MTSKCGIAKQVRCTLLNIPVPQLLRLVGRLVQGDIRFIPPWTSKTLETVFNTCIQLSCGLEGKRSVFDLTKCKYLTGSSDQNADERIVS